MGRDLLSAAGVIALAIYVIGMPLTFVYWARMLERDPSSRGDRANPWAAAGWALFWPIFVPLFAVGWAVLRAYKAAVR